MVLKYTTAYQRYLHLEWSHVEKIFFQWQPVDVFVIQSNVRLLRNNLALHTERFEGAFLFLEVFS